MWLTNRLLLPLLVYCFVGRVTTTTPSPPTVRVEQGEVAGTWYTLPDGRRVNAFFGIPYAVPPVHKYRFKEPHDLKPWAGVWNASIRPSFCLQYDHRSYSVRGEEDCLYLNVFTPQLPKDGVSPLRNVLVYIHGGAFMFGIGTTVDPDYLMQHADVVYVTVNYRVGPLGFLSTADNVAPGNNGLKDQAAALKWVHHNIIQFGGNPASVTIAGCSAGGASVHYHYLSPLSNGLFQKGISFSGTVLLPWTLPKNNTDKSIRLAALAGCPTANTRDMVKCLQRRPARQLVEMTKYFSVWRYCPFTMFGPVVEPASPNAFLSEQPIQILREGRMKHLPWLISMDKDEGLYPGAEFIGVEDDMRELDLKWNEIVPHLFMFNYSVASEAEKNKVSAEIRRFYFGNQSVSRATASQLVQALGDRLYYNDIIRAAKLHSANSNESVYCYFFNYRGKYSLSNIYADDSVDYGVSHADDVSYVLQFLGSDAQETESDAAMVRFMVSWVDSFMKTGRSTNNDNSVWPALSKNTDDNLRCLHINSPHERKMGEFSNVERSTFWRDILPSEYAADAVAAAAEMVAKNEL